MRRAVASAFPAALVTSALVVFPAVGGRYEVDLVSTMFVLAILALSLQLLVGQAGLVSLGHAAFMALGAYTAAFLLRAPGPRSLWLMALAGMGVAATYALPVAALSLRTRGVYFIMVTLAFAQLVYFVLHDTGIAGGSDGVSVTGVPELSFFGWVPFDVTRSRPFYYTALVILIMVFALLTLLGRSRFGRALTGIRLNEQRMRAVGFSTYPYKIGAFVVAAMLAGLAGVLRAAKDGYVNPELSSWHQSGAVLVMIILGGVGRLRGAVIGAFTFVLLQELFREEALFGALARRWQLMLGLTIIASGMLLPAGLAGLSLRLRLRRRARG